MRRHSAVRFVRVCGLGDNIDDDDDDDDDGDDDGDDDDV